MMLKPFAWWYQMGISQYFCNMAGSLWNPFGIVSKIGTPHSHGYAIKIHQGWAFAMNINPVGFVWKSCRYHQIQWLIIIFWKKKGHESWYTHNFHQFSDTTSSHLHLASEDSATPIHPEFLRKAVDLDQVSTCLAMFATTFHPIGFCS